MTFEQIKENIQYGDYNTLQHLLKAKSVAAGRMRFLRGDKDAIDAMIFIQKNRKQLVEEYKNQKSDDAKKSN